MNGLFNEDALIRQSCKNGLKDLPSVLADQAKKVETLDYLFNNLATKYFLEGDKRANSHLFLELLNDVTTMKSMTIGEQEGLIFDITEQLIEKMIA